MERLIELLDFIPAGISLADLEGKILYVNPRSRNALGYSHEELVGTDIGALYRDAVTGGDGVALKRETLAFRKDGSNFPVFLESSVVRDYDGAPMAALVVARDLSEQRAFQQRRLSDARLDTLGLISHSLAHEVRNHLSAIKMSLYMLETAGESAGDQATHFSIAREEVDRIELFLRTLENYATPPAPRFQAADLVEVVNKGIEDARPFLIRKSITLLRQFPRGSPTLRLDREQLAQAVTQVVQNAAQGVEERGEIHVIIKRQGRPGKLSWLLEVRDNGSGVAPHLEGDVFAPFFSTYANQLGLGLSNVARILSLHGGSASLTSTSGGTVVVLQIPEGDE